MSRLRIGTRGSTLALAQSAWVKKKIEEHDAQLQIELRIIKTSGDRFVEAPVAAIGGKGIFTKEIEEALLQGEIDLAVHSLKDLPMDLPKGLGIVAVPEREDARDVLISGTKDKLADLKPGAKVATGSLRRRAQILNARPDLTVVPLRGNIDTRLKKLERGDFDALVLAAAGLRRIGREDRIGEFLSDDVCVSAVAQGALGIEARDEKPIRDCLSFLHHPPTFVEVSAERAFADRLGGGCNLPIGGRARLSGDEVTMIGIVASADGKRLCRGKITGRASKAVKLGEDLADGLLNEGAHSLLTAV